MISSRILLAAGLAALAMVSAAGAGAVDTLDDPRIKEEFLGPMAIEPTTGDIYTYMKVTTGGGCPGGTNSITRIFGKGFPNYGENIIGNTEVYEFMNKVEGRMVAPVTITLDEAMKRQPQRTTLNGTYRLTFTCQEPLPTSYDMLYGYYEGYIKFDDNKYTAVTKAEDLPKKPTPKSGPAALALANQPQANYHPELAAMDAAKAAEAAALAAQVDEPGGSAGLAMSIVAVILVATTGGAFFARRRSQITPSEGSDR